MYFLYPCPFSWCVAVVFVSRHDSFLPLGLQECTSLPCLHARHPSGERRVGTCTWSGKYRLFLLQILAQRHDQVPFHTHAYVCGWYALLLIRIQFAICQTAKLKSSLNFLAIRYDRRININCSNDVATVCMDQNVVIISMFTLQIYIR